MRRDTSTMEETSKHGEKQLQQSGRGQRPTVTFSPTPPTGDVFDWPFPDMKSNTGHAAPWTLCIKVSQSLRELGALVSTYGCKNEYTTLNITRDRCCHRERVRRCRMQENRNHGSQ